jgi:putative CocE/NonD family hydrolase
MARFERNLLVELPDGAELAADLRLPSEAGRHPTLLSYYPYRKDDVIGAAYEHANTYFATRGYASLLVDFRGLGSSSGAAADAMDASEAQDLIELLAWTAAQPWCDGNIGMWGISYGGITSFRAAAAGSPHLKAIAPIFASIDTYRDWFYPGGCRNCLGALAIWGPLMLGMQLAPPMHTDSEGRWRRVWRERLEAQPYVLPWLEHPDRDAYWASKAIPVEQIGVPALLVGGWRDLFPEAMPRAFERIGAPKRLLVGPWLHTAPDVSRFVKVDYLDELGAFFDHWLRGGPDPLAPPVTFFVQGEGGGWRHEQTWPVPHEQRLLFLESEGRLSSEPPARESTVEYVGDPTVGTCAGLWDPLGTSLGLPLDQGPDEQRSLTFTSEPLSEALEITGSPVASLRIALDEGDELTIVAKLSEVLPDGRSSLVTTGWRQAGHRTSDELREPIPVHEVLDYRVPLWATSYRVGAGSRLRLSLACADFPRIWPTRTNPRIRVVAGGEGAAAVALPVATPSGLEAPDPPQPDPAVDRAPGTVAYEPRWTIERDLAEDAVTVRTGMRWTLATPGRDGRMTVEHMATAMVARERPDAATVRGETSMDMRLPTGAHVEVTAASVISGNSISLSGRVEMDRSVVFERRWQN